MENRKFDAKRWFQQAAFDLEAVRWNIEGKFYDTACFLAQQSAEKALKALLYFSGARKKALMTHSLFEMLNEIIKNDKSFSDSLPEAKQLDMHYVPSRYPNGIPGGFPHQFYEKKMADSALAATETIFNSVKKYFEARGENEILS